MIICKVNSTVYTITEMENSNFKFFLTGSRFFGTHHENSDWDFFVEDSPQIRKVLENWGFVEENKYHYFDMLTNIVYAHKQANIHVQCVKNARIKEHIQNSLLETTKKHPNFWTYLPKCYRHLVWKAMTNLFFYMQKIT